jgi:hypothetical protein
MTNKSFLPTVRRMSDSVRRRGRGAGQRAGDLRAGVTTQRSWDRAGWRADFVAVLGNPLEDIRAMAAPVFLMKAGRVVHRVSAGPQPAE